MCIRDSIYAKAKDKAGNTSNIIRTDGIVIDTVAPQISIDHHGGNWSTQEYVDVDVSDFSDVEHAIVGNASGIRKISYETYETSPVEGEVEINDNRARDVYKRQVFNEQDNSSIAGKSNYSSAITEFKVNLQQTLDHSDYSMLGDKVVTESEYYNEKGTSFNIESSFLKEQFPYIRIGTLEELNLSLIHI